MVEVRRTRAPEIPLARFFIALFTLVVAVGLYYVVGGPIPYAVEFGGPTGAAFEGRYAITADVTSVPPEAAETFTATFPHTLTFWGSSRESVIASVTTGTAANVLTTITVRRAGVVCSRAYRWGAATDVICE